MNVAFMCWNPFQLAQFSNVIKKFESYKVVVLDKGSNLVEFDKQKLKKYNHVIVKSRHVPDIDGVFDIIFFQSPFPGIENIKLSRLVSIQYGLAKERHDYGEWRSLADMNLMYGEYSASIVEHYAPSYSVGNPKFDYWNDYLSSERIASVKEELHLDQKKKTLLYMPTWGELGSFLDLCEEFSKLSDDYNLLLKMHHNNEHELREWVKIAQSHHIEHLFHGDYDQLKLLSVADMVISDFSGAIFDAMFAEKPILLYQANLQDKINVQKFNLDSLEYRERDTIGLVCEDKSHLRDSVRQLFLESQQRVEKYSTLRQSLFYRANTPDHPPASELILDYSTKLVENSIPPLTFTQKCVRECVQEVRRLRRIKNSR